MPGHLGPDLGRPGLLRDRAHQALVADKEFGIGAFASAGRVSVRMRWHYDALGLLAPAHLDAVTGTAFTKRASFPYEPDRRAQRPGIHACAGSGDSRRQGSTRRLCRSSAPVSYYEGKPDGILVHAAAFPVTAQPGGHDFAVLDLPGVEQAATIVHQDRWARSGRRARRLPLDRQERLPVVRTAPRGLPVTRGRSREPGDELETPVAEVSE